MSSTLTSKYTIRAPFAVHLVHTSTVEDHDGRKRLVRKEESFFHSDGKPIELSNADALAHMHKLEPADDASRQLFQEFHDKQERARAARQAQDGSGNKSLGAQVSEAVVGALIAAGVVKVKAS
jgi:hypothetical protein